MNDATGEKVFTSGPITVTGTVYWDETRQRVSGAVIKAVPGDRKEAALVALADDDGDFTLTSLSAGTWTFLVFDEEGHVSRKHEIELKSDQPAATCDLSIPRRMDERDRRAGQWFLMGLCLGLAEAVGPLVIGGGVLLDRGAMALSGSALLGAGRRPDQPDYHERQLFALGAFLPPGHPHARVAHRNGSALDTGARLHPVAADRQDHAHRWQ